MKEATEYKHRVLARNKLRICERCKCEYRAFTNAQRFCGSYREKTGCSFLEKFEYQKIYREKYRKSEANRKAQLLFKERHPGYFTAKHRKEMKSYETI